MFDAGADQALFRHRVRGRDQRAGAHAPRAGHHGGLRAVEVGQREEEPGGTGPAGGGEASGARSEEHTSELQSLMRISYAVFRLKKKNKNKKTQKQRVE